MVDKIVDKEYSKAVYQVVLSILYKRGIRLNSVDINRAIPRITIGKSFLAEHTEAEGIIGSIPRGMNDRVWIIYYLHTAEIQF